ALLLSVLFAFSAIRPALSRRAASHHAGPDRGGRLWLEWGMPPVFRHVCFDLDRTLVDDSGLHLRPAMRELLEALAGEGIELSLWTASIRDIAMDILRRHRIDTLFRHFVFRDDYDPEGAGHPKDISYLNADLLVDDSPKHIEFVRKQGRAGFLITPFINSGAKLPKEELRSLREMILGPSGGGGLRGRRE
ncbi:MAG: NIF family HAD-type phosphatase, partial [Kiritimatiellia bacterium]